MIRIIYFIPLLLLCWGCNDFLNEEPEVSVTNNNYWKTEQDVESAVYGMHLQFRYAMGNGNPQDRDRGVIFDMLPAPWLRLVNNDLRSFYQISDSRLFWRDYYNVICLTNSILDNISRASLPEERYLFLFGTDVGGPGMGLFLYYLQLGRRSLDLSTMRTWERKDVSPGRRLRSILLVI